MEYGKWKMISSSQLDPLSSILDPLSLSVSQRQIIFQHERVEARAFERPDRVSWAANDRLLDVERRVEQSRDARQPPELFDQIPISRIGRAADGLRARSVVDVNDAGDALALTFGHSEDGHHKRVAAADAEYLRAGFFQHRRRQRPEPFAQLNLLVEQLAHIGAARVSEEAAIA